VVSVVATGSAMHAARPARPAVAAHVAAVQHYAMRRLVIPVLLAVLLPSFAAAQQTAHEVAQPQVSLAYGLHYGNPLRYSAVLGAIIDLDPGSRDGVLLLVEPGTNGAEASVGYLRMIGRFGSGVSVRASVLRTGSEPWNANPHSTYVGAELEWMVILGVGGRAGLFRRASGDPGGHDGIATIGVSLGI
jgi:hypothetical protein